MNTIRSREKYKQYKGKEIFNIKPIILGGDPLDPANKTILNRGDHINAVNFWNKIIKGLRSKGGRSDLT